MVARRELMAAALQAITGGGTVPIEHIPRHRAAVQLGTWARAAELTDHERELLLSAFYPGPRAAPYGQPFAPLPRATCDICGRTVHQPQSPAGRPLAWVHDVSPIDLHRPAVFGQPPPPVPARPHPLAGVNARTRDGPSFGRRA